jgi:hypothetical protein
MSGLIGIAAIVIVAWFAAGTVWNVRAGRELMRWMQGGLPVLGGRTTVRWLGSSVVEMVIADARAPFASATLVIFLEPRDLPWWPLSRLRGRRDTLIVRGVLRRTPSLELEILAPASWSARDAMPRVPKEWAASERDSMKVFGDERRAGEMLAKAPRGVRRLSVRRAEPHFQLHVPLPGRHTPAREFFENVRALAELALA